MKKSTETLLWVAGGIAALYALTKNGALGANNAATTVCPRTGAVRTGSATNPCMGGQNFGVCPSGGWC